MATTIKIGTVQIRDEDYAIQANAVLGIRGTGKTTLAKSIAEQMLDAKIPIIVFDPTGVWRYLKRGAKKGQRGYSIVVAGGVEPDLQLTPTSAAEIVRAAIKENVSLVIDLYDRKLSKGDWRRIVRDCFRTLMYENEGVRHIFLEEAAEFAPQRVQDGETYAEVEKVVRMGGNASLGITLINQRSQEVNKAVLELCENLVLMKQRGSHAIDAISKWVDKINPATSAEITNSMPNMGAGECWVFRGDEGDVRRTHSNKLHTFHPDRRRPEAIKRAGKAPDVAKFVTRLGARLKDKSATDTVESLRAQIKKYEHGKVFAAKASGTIDKADLKAANDDVARYKKRVKELEERIERMQTAHKKASVVILNDVPMALKISGEPEYARVLRPMLEKVHDKHTKQLRDLVDNVAHSDTALSKGERKVLTCVAQYENEGVTDSQLAVLTGYKETSRYTYLKTLRAKGYIVTSGNCHMATVEGLAALGEFERLPEGDALREHWRRTLKGGELELFTTLANGPLSDAELGELTGYKATSIYTYLKKLRARRIVVTRDGMNRIAPSLFD